MLRLRTLIAVCTGSIALTAGLAAADDGADVGAAAEAWITAVNAGDVANLIPLYHADETSFGGFGGLLSEGVHTEDEMSALFESGFKTDLKWRHVAVKVFGKAAVVTGYLAGSATLPGGTVVQNSWRTSMMWVHDGEAWQIVHFHASTLFLSDG